MRLHHMFLEADDLIVRALAFSIARVGAGVPEVVRNFVRTRRGMVRAAEAGGRSLPLRTAGRFFDLQELFAEIFPIKKRPYSPGYPLLIGEQKNHGMGVEKRHDCSHSEGENSGSESRSSAMPGRGGAFPMGFRVPSGCRRNRSLPL